MKWFVSNENRISHKTGYNRKRVAAVGQIKFMGKGKNSAPEGRCTRKTAFTIEGEFKAETVVNGNVDINLDLETSKM